MSKYKFPVASVDGNKLVSLKGESSYFYKINSVDLEQMDNIEVQSLYERISSNLFNLDADEWLKFYHLNGENYLNSKTQNPLIGLELSKQNNPLEIFFGCDDIYSDLGIYDDYLLYNGRYKRIITVKNFNESDIDQYYLPRGVDYVLSLIKLRSDEALKKLERIRTAQKVSLNKGKRDFEGEGAYFQAESLIEDITHSKEAIFDMQLSFIVEAESLHLLNEKVNSFLSELKVLGMTPVLEGHSLKQCKSGLFEIFKSLIVGVMPTFELRGIPNKLGHLKYLLPISKSLLMDEEIEFRDISDMKIHFDPFSNIFKSRNMLVTGSTGGGKSVFVNKLAHLLAKDHPIVIIDKGGSFKKLCSYHGGFELSDSINPMQFPNPQYLRELILSMVDKEKFSKLDKGRLVKEIKEYLSQNKKSSFWALLSYLEESGFNEISLYFEDIKDFITDEIIPTNNFLYVDVELYPKALISPVVIYTLEYFKNLQNKEKVLVFDECWSFLSEHGEYIEECFRTFRKSGALPIAISQGMSDFNEVGGSLSRAITNNSHFKVFFPQEYIEEKGISEFDNGRISSLQFEKGRYSECYLKTDDNKIKKILRIYLTPLEFELFNTDAHRSEKLFKFISDYKTYFQTNKECFESFVRLQHG